MHKTLPRFLSFPITICLVTFSSFVLFGCDSNPVNTVLTPVDDNVLNVWWSEGYYPEETEAIQSSINAWQTKNNVDVQITFFSEKDLVQQVENAIKAGNAPDIIYSYSIDLVLLPRLAWEGKLADVSSIIDPIKQSYDQEALKNVNYFNNQIQKRSYYAVPISQQTTYIHYWQDLLDQAGISNDKLPKEWDSFWRLWEVAQTNLTKQNINNIYAIGLPMSAVATDTFTVFEQFLEAYNVQLLDDQGKLRFDDPQVRQSIIKALQAYTNPYLENFVPPNAIEWGDPDNNINFLSNGTLMTANGSLSIPGSQKGDPINYFRRMRTIPWPNKPDNTPMRYVTSIKQIAILAETDRLEEAKSLVGFLVETENLEAYLQGAQGRFLPVMPAIAANEFWSSGKDPHIAVAITQFDNARSSYVVLNPAYSEVLAQNVWGEVIHAIATNQITPEKGADQAIEKITDIFSQWK
ncbi:ABC transporter substrate-binding protein [Synechocystis salina]|uniref:ABC transporter substrate-binding protein n=1 Tax=Synechocystis salina TaxID=945780 RepID=UPI001D13938E|nr:ABC transporter substrate-binding protein [Synechocystis salina]